MRIPTIAFVFPPGGDAPSYRHHLGVAYIQAFLCAKGIYTTQVIPPKGSTVDEFTAAILETAAPIIGLTCYDNNYFLVRRLARLLKRKSPDKYIVAGGPSATFSDELILSHTEEVDICVRFEGEHTMHELLLHLLNRSLNNLDEVSGISYRRKGTVVKTPDRAAKCQVGSYACDLDQYPSPYLTGILAGTEGAGILSSRGCTYRCSYCCFSSMSKQSVRYHSVDRVIAELKAIEKALKNADSGGISFVNIHDDAFSLNATRAKEICRRLIEEGIELNLSCLCRADNLDDELLRLLRYAGFSAVNIGLESGVPHVLRNIRKVSMTSCSRDGNGLAPEERFLRRAQEIVMKAKTHGLRTAVSYILGLPGETAEDGRKTVEFAEKLDADHYAHNYLMVFPGTELFRTAEKWGINVHESQCKLPYETKHLYDVFSIPFPENSSLHRNGSVAARSVQRSFAGGLPPQQMIGNGIAYAVLKAKGALLQECFNWLSGFLAVNGKITVLGVDGGDVSRQVWDALIESEAPTRECYVLVSDTDPIAKTVYRFNMGTMMPWSFEFPVIPLKRALEFARATNHQKKLSNIIYSFEARSDLSIMCCLSESENQSDLSQQAELAFFNGVFLDGCRWCGNRCPATNLQRVVITEHGEILPCVSGRPLGTLSDPANVLRGRAKDLWFHAQSERGCEKCSAVEWCPKCLFPFPVNAKDYCEIQREYPGIRSLILQAKLANAFSSISDESF